MNSIGGNITAQIQIKTENSKNRLGEKVMEWETLHEVKGFIDLMSGTSNYTSYNTKLQESTHVFICDYFPISLKISDARMLINEQIYDVKFIDDPMGIHEHLEIFLEVVGVL